MIVCQWQVILAKVIVIFIKNESCSFSYVHYFYTQLPIGIVIKFSYCFKTVLIIAAHRTIGGQFHG